MFDLFRSREKLVRILLGAVLVIVAVSMVTYLIPSSGLTADPNSDQTVVAEVGDEKITATEAQAAVDSLVRGGQLPPDAAQVYLPQFVDQMVQERAAIYQFAKQGLAVTDDEVLAGFVAVYPQLFQNGKLVSTDLLTQTLAQQGLTLDGGLEKMRKQILLKKVQNMAYASVIVTPQEVNAAIVNKHRTVKIEYVAFPAGKFRDQVKPTPDELQAAYQAEKASYSLPEKRSFDVLVVDQAKVEHSIELTDVQLRAAYAGSMDNFRTPEKVRARHILVMTQGKSDAEKKQLKTKAEGLLKQLKGGADFAELAKKNSDDPGSAQRGGELDPFVKGQMVPEFEKYAFSAEPNKLSDLVETMFGYHIIQVLGKEPAKIKPFEEVKDSIAQQLKKQNVNEKMQQLADQAHAALIKSPGSAAEVAKQFNLELASAKNAAPADAIPVVGSSPEITGALTTMKVKDVSDPLVIPGNRMAIVVLNDLVPARPAAFAEVQDRVRDRFIGNRSLALANEAAQKTAKRAQAGEDLEAMAKSLNLDLSKSADVTINDNVEGLGPIAVLPEAFTKPVGSVTGPVSVQGRNIVFKILDQKSVDASQYGYERDAAYQELKQKKARTAFDLMQDSIVAQARADGRLKIYSDRIQRLALSYRSSR